MSCASHHVHVLVAGSTTSLFDGFDEAADKNELAPGRLLLGAVGHDEGRGVPRVPITPMARRLVGPAPGDHRAVAAEHLFQPELVLTGRLTTLRCLVAPGTTEHPEVEPLSADTQPATGAVVPPGDVTVDGSGDGCDNLPHALSFRRGGLHRPDTTSDGGAARPSSPL
ncbi:MAG TPA: hypothetical protein VK386_00185 [Acidimicrobiales bacterium]|nr:hypothetical protein [Acidimicrobiales bacterium]